MIAKEPGLGFNNTTKICSEINNASKDEIIDNSIEDLKSIFVIDGIAMDIHCLPNMYWLPKIHKTSIKDRFIAVSPRSSMNTLTKTIISTFSISRSEILTINVDFLQVSIPFGLYKITDL